MFKTQIISLNIFNKTLYLKLEYQNIAGSIKDRVAYFILGILKKVGKVDKDTIVCEATSGNTGIGIASFCAKNKIPSLIFLPENTSLEKIKILKLFGTNLVVTPKEIGLAGSLRLLKTFLKNEFLIIDNTLVSKKDKNLYGKLITNIEPKKFYFFKKYFFNQFENPLNWICHYKTTAREILEFLGEKKKKINIDAFGCGVGTGGSIYGISRALKEKYKTIKVFSVLPKEYPHDIEGIGPNFEPLFYRKLKEENLLDEEIKLSTLEVKSFLKDFIKHTGIPIGLSAAANILASLIFLDKHNLNSALTLVPDNVYKYLTKISI